MIEQNTRQQKQFKILLIGDKCTDVYQYGNIDRLSPEAPVPIFVPTHKEEREGMAGNVYANLIALGCTVDIVCGIPSKKTRLIDSRTKQQILRIDEDTISIPVAFTSADGYDAVVISDYNKGVVSYDLIEGLIENNRIPFFIDTKKTDLERMQGAWVKVNETEYSRITSECTGLIVTKGPKATEVVHHEIKIEPPKVEVVDITGAGDTFIAALAYKFLETKDIRLSVDFANKAASITVKHFGTYAPTLEEIK